LYENFIQSDDVVNITNLLAELITGVDKVIESFGGMGKMILTIALMFSGRLIPTMLSGLTSLGANFATLFGFT
jgi:hypothetical protein